MLSRSAPENLLLDQVVTSTLFDPAFTLLPSTSLVPVGQTMPLEGANPFELPHDSSLAADGGVLGCLDDMDLDITEGLSEDAFHIADWSRYMSCPETGFVTQ